MNVIPCPTAPGRSQGGKERVAWPEPHISVLKGTEQPASGYLTNISDPVERETTERPQRMRASLFLPGISELCNCVWQEEGDVS